MMYASDPPTAPLAAMMRNVDTALIAESGFPLEEPRRSGRGQEKVVIEHTVLSIAPGDVPEALLAIPKGYRDAGAPAPVNRAEELTASNDTHRESGEPLIRLRHLLPSHEGRRLLTTRSWRDRTL